jgi:hypothetical protein
MGKRGYQNAQDLFITQDQRRCRRKTTGPDSSIEGRATELRGRLKAPDSSESLSARDEQVERERAPSLLS